MGCNNQKEHRENNTKFVSVIDELAVESRLYNESEIARLSQMKRLFALENVKLAEQSIEEKTNQSTSKNSSENEENTLNKKLRQSYELGEQGQRISQHKRARGESDHNQSAESLNNLSECSIEGHYVKRN